MAPEPPARACFGLQPPPHHSAYDFPFGRIVRAGVCLALLQWQAGMAEPRPEPYGAGSDLFTDARQALLSEEWGSALTALQRLSREMPEIADSAEFHNLMGFALRQLGPAHLGAAIRHYQQALQLEPTHVQAREYLGRAFLMQGRVDLAREQLQKIEHTCMNRACSAWRSLQQAILSHAG